MARYSISQIKHAYIQKKDWEKQFPVSYYLFRPISFYVTYLVLLITKSPSVIAWFGLFIGLLGCFSFLFISNLTIWPGILLLLIFALLDAVDGNIARVTKKVTHYGKYLDGIIGIIIEGGYCFWLGLGLYFNPASLGIYNVINLWRNGPILNLLAGVMIMAGILYSRIFEGDYYNHLIQKQRETGAFQGALTQNIRSSTYRRHWWYLLFVNLHAFNLQLILLALCAALGAVDIFLFVLAAYYFVRLLTTMLFYTYRAQENLR
ncbi:MAG: CDP-alcohol phosphatidyltransferase family protein [Candidatus Omnitrophota bacterium]|jgi:phosphatidylglycerophosphate synthase